MKKLILLLAILFSPVPKASDIVDVEFSDSRGVSYRTTTLISDLESEYGLELNGAKILLIETPSLEEPSYKLQNKELGSLGHKAEEFQVLYVIACPKEKYQHGYHTSIETAEKLLGANPRFRVRHLNAEGIVVNESLVPVLGETLEQWLSK